MCSPGFYVGGKPIKVKIGEALCREQQSRPSAVPSKVGTSNRVAPLPPQTIWQINDNRLSPALFGPPTISIMSVLMYTEQPQSQGHGRGKHTCRKQSSDRIIKCHDWFSSLGARSVYCVGGVEPYCCGLCCPAPAQELRQAGRGGIICKCYGLP